MRENFPESAWVRILFRLLLRTTSLGCMKCRTHLECMGYKDAEDIDPPFKELMVCYTKNSY